ncbi:MAG: hypothetical protein JWR44_2685 [Hymenobacter sp.]|jgi:hypothetical protein|nr:hypothetical protein [Hymenobacter sp.]
MRHGRQWFGGAVALSVLVQLALFAWATAPGLAGTSDSTLYLHAAGTLRTAGALLNPDGTAYRFWPPLYPVLLAGCGSLGGIRLLHAACLVGSLLLWSWLGRHLLPGRRAQLLPMLLALSTPWLLVSKFVWSESAFLLLFAVYAAVLFQWLRSGRGAWWWAATVAGFLLPLERTLGLFLLMGVGVGLLLGTWQKLPSGRRILLALHLLLSVAGGLLWQWYALLLAGPSRYHPSRGLGQLLSSGADFGFVLGRWLLPFPTAVRELLPHAVWLLGLLGLFSLLWPRSYKGSASTAYPTEIGSSIGFASASSLASIPLLRVIWSASLILVAFVAVLTVFAQSAAGIHDGERYASVLFAPIVMLALAAWPERAPRWLGQALAVVWLLTAALRVGHVASDLHRLRPLAPWSATSPAPHGQRVGAAGQ